MFCPKEFVNSLGDTGVVSSGEAHMENMVKLVQFSESEAVCQDENRFLRLPTQEP
jgi:hypothetical protein